MSGEHQKSGLAPLWLVSGLALVASLSHLYFNTIGNVPDLWVAALHFGVFGALCFLTTPLISNTKNSWAQIGFGVDALLAGLVVACAIYLIFAEDEIDGASYY